MAPYPGDIKTVRVGIFREHFTLLKHGCLASLVTCRVRCSIYSTIRIRIRTE